MKSIDTRAYLDQLSMLIEEGKEVNLVVSGSSMHPFLIHKRDAVLLKKPDRAYRVGDVVLFRRCSGKYVLHRICRISPLGAYLIGDGQTIAEGPVACSQIVAAVTQVRRDGFIVRPGDLVWEFFEHVWIHMIPLRPILSRIYAAVIKVFRRA